MRTSGFIRAAFASAILAGSALAFSSAAYADSAKWSDAKRDQINTNRNSDAGVGNGGEARIGTAPSDNWTNTTIGEDGPYDRDPGNSGGGRNQAAKNDDRPQSKAGGGTGILIHPGY